MRVLIQKFRAMTCRTSCPVPAADCPAAKKRRQLLRLWLPLVMFALPTVVIAYGFVISSSCIAGFNSLTFGFGTTVVGACMSYVAGVRAARRS